MISPPDKLTKRKIIVTSALPYSNGDIHLGHLVEYLQTDFWVRFQKMRGHDCLYFCADDTHGTPIMIAAKKKKISPEDLIKKQRELHIQDFEDFEIEFTHYSSTHSEINRSISEKIFKAMDKKGHIYTKKISQYYCEKNCHMFLPDRFIKGTCPRCLHSDQYGDSCENCSSTYSSIEIIDPQCTQCSETPVIKESEHLFFNLSNFQNFLKDWTRDHTQEEVKKKLNEWLDHKLHPWDISRDAPYFGFEIPGYPKKYFYVWVDAPIGYIAATEEWCQKQQNQDSSFTKNYLDFWSNQNYEIYHFIGKDIIYFHSLFWPAMLTCASLSTPTKIFSHGFLTINKEKMSKSKGTFVNARDYLNHLNPLYLRYYFATKVNSKLNDLDFNTEDFIHKINSELIGKITNLASRSSQFIEKKLNKKLGKMTEKGIKLHTKITEKKKQIADYYEKREFSLAMIEIRNLVDQANQYVDQQSPWKVFKTDPEKALSILTDTLNHFRALTIYLTPILPSYSSNVSKWMKEPPYVWESLNTTIELKPLDPYPYLIKRIEPKALDFILMS